MIEKVSLDLKSKLRVVPGFPKKGVNFIDITTLLKDPEAFKSAIDVMTGFFSEKKIDVLVGIEARGFLIGAPVAYNLGIGFVPARKRGKLPAEKLEEEYSLEYGSELLEMHRDGIKPGQRVGIVDDLLATGGTARAASVLVEKIGGAVASIGFLVELDFLKGREKIRGYDVFSLVHFDE
ncbi:MAG: adenine phosphoribosyltransferase [Nitrososphaerales archaeon]